MPVIAKHHIDKGVDGLYNMHRHLQHQMLNHYLFVFLQNSIISIKLLTEGWFISKIKFIESSWDMSVMYNLRLDVDIIWIGVKYKNMIQNRPKWTQMQSLDKLGCCEMELSSCPTCVVSF